MRLYVLLLLEQVLGSAGHLLTGSPSELVLESVSQRWASWHFCERHSCDLGLR